MKCSPPSLTVWQNAVVNWTDRVDICCQVVRSSCSKYRTYPVTGCGNHSLSATVADLDSQSPNNSTALELSLRTSSFDHWQRRRKRVGTEDENMRSIRGILLRIAAATRVQDGVERRERRAYLKSLSAYLLYGTLSVRSMFHQGYLRTTNRFPHAESLHARWCKYVSLISALLFPSPSSFLQCCILPFFRCIWC